MQKQRIIILAVAILLAAAAVLLVKNYIDQEREKALGEAKTKVMEAQKTVQANQVSVLVAKDDIPKGAIIKAEYLAVSMIPGQFVQPQAVNSAAFEKISGMMAAVPIVKGEQITLTKLTKYKEEEAITRSLAMSTPKGKRAIAVAVDNISSLSGLIRQGDYADVIAILPMPQSPGGTKESVQTEIIPLFQNILILAVGQETGKGASSKDSSLITLALGPKEASLIAFVQEQGKIRLILRSSADANIEDIEPANWEALFRYIRPAQEKAQQKVAQEQAKQPEIEIYRGLSKEKITLSE